LIARVQRHLANPQREQSNVEDERVGHGHHHQEEIRRELEHGLVLEYDESEEVTESTEDDDDRWNVQQQKLVNTILLVLHHLLQCQTLLLYKYAIRMTTCIYHMGHGTMQGYRGVKIGAREEE